MIVVLSNIDMHSLKKKSQQMEMVKVSKKKNQSRFLLYSSFWVLVNSFFPPPYSFLHILPGFSAISSSTVRDSFFDNARAETIVIVQHPRTLR